MFIDYTRLERHLYIDDKKLSAYLLQEIDSEISLLHEAIENKKRDIKNRNQDLIDCEEYINNPEKYIAAQIKHCTENIYHYIGLLECNKTLIKSIGQSIEKMQKRYASNVKEREEIAFSITSLKTNIKKIENRQADIKKNIQTYEKDIPMLKKLSVEEASVSIKNIFTLSKGLQEADEFIVEKCKNEIEKLEKAKKIMRENVKEHDTKFKAVSKKSKRKVSKI